MLERVIEFEREGIGSVSGRVFLFFGKSKGFIFLDRELDFW